MKKLSIICEVMLVVLSAGQAFALPGVYRAGSPTMDLYVGQCETRTISMDGTGWGTSPLVSGGFLMTLSDMTKVAITACQCYDGTLTPAVWDAGIEPVGVCDGCSGTDPIGYPGGLFVAAANLGAGVTPSANILVCDVTFCGIETGSSTLTIDTSLDFGDWVAQDTAVYDPYIDPATINATVSINYCEGDFDYDGDQDGSDAALFKTDFGRSGLLNPCPPDGPAPVQKTGQIVMRGAAGDDGDLEKGIAWPSQRFSDNENGSVTDNLTGLVWLKTANCFGPRTWNEALSDCNTLNTGECGLADGSSVGDWRLANRYELESLLDMAYHSPALSNSAGTDHWSEGDPFDNVQSGHYWSSTSFASKTLLPWRVSIGDGVVDYVEDSNPGYVWPVRGGH